MSSPACSRWVRRLACRCTGANRLGSNSLIDLVVFGRATGLRIKDQLKPGTPHNPLPKGSEELALSRLDRFRNANGATPTAKLRTEMQRTMQKHCAVSATRRC